jgi:hypothetical protein
MRASLALKITRNEEDTIRPSESFPLLSVHLFCIPVSSAGESFCRAVIGMEYDTLAAVVLFAWFWPTSCSWTVIYARGCKGALR